MSPETGVASFSGGGETVRRGSEAGLRGEEGGLRAPGGERVGRGVSVSRGDLIAGNTAGGAGIDSSAGEMTSSAVTIGVISLVNSVT